MNNTITITKTENEAILTAKTQSIRLFEKTKDCTIDDSKFIDANIWLVEPIKVQCACGQTAGIRVVLLASYLTDALLGFDENELTFSNEQYSSKVGYCEHCGE